jgi:hypothetical protein
MCFAYITDLYNNVLYKTRRETFMAPTDFLLISFFTSGNFTVEK